MACIDLEPSDALWQDVPDVVLKPIEWMDGAPVGEGGEWCHRTLVLDAEGNKGGPTPMEWSIEVAALPQGVLSYWAQTPNSAVRVGEFLAISLGRFFPAEEVEVDGERMVKLISPLEVARLRKALQDDWLDEHPQVRASKPAWADTIGADYYQGGDPAEVDVWFERLIGSVRMSKHAEFKGGVLTWDDDSTDPYVTLEKWEDLDAAEMRDLVSALLAAIPVIEAASA